ncbi:hypothetical protein BDV93DRAFT_558279 [Ceratobasidium sp. AG-I]|nr:hypothetical protein BDV93DRAFT_558279 [Ceratobasidium sp. AG-I]
MDSSFSTTSQLQTRAAQQGWNAVSSLNEPDQSEITPGNAANWNIQSISPLATKSCSFCFVQRERRCYFNCVNIHWYGNSFAAFQSHVQHARNRFPNY